MKTMVSQTIHIHDHHHRIAFHVPFRLSSGERLNDRFPLKLLCLDIDPCSWFGLPPLLLLAVVLCVLRRLPDELPIDDTMLRKKPRSLFSPRNDMADASLGGEW